MRSVTARACANIALIKYWGKRDELTNSPATPSLSLTLKQLTTTTTVERLDDSTAEETLIINGTAASEKENTRFVRYLDLWREVGLIEGRFRAESENSFPTGSGLASSASGYAALAKALSGFSERKLGQRELSQLARRGSGSAARSIPGGISILPTGADPASRQILPPEQVPWSMVIAEVESQPKSIGSTQGMNLSRDTSPYYRQWAATAKRDYRVMLDAVSRLDFTAVGSLAEANSNAMHACMIATRPSLTYWNEVTLRVLHAVRDWRNDGLECYATIDAGPHVCLLVRNEDAQPLKKKVSELIGVKRVTISEPGPGAEILETV